MELVRRSTGKSPLSAASLLFFTQLIRSIPNPSPLTSFYVIAGRKQCHAHFKIIPGADLHEAGQFAVRVILAQSERSGCSTGIKQDSWGVDTLQEAHMPHKHIDTYTCHSIYTVHMCVCGVCVRACVCVCV